ncbi:unnamed protein product, partial [marine sediment metagenome]
MKIILVTGMDPSLKGAGVTHIKELTINLRNLGHQVYVFAPFIRDTKKDTDIFKRIPYVNLPFPNETFDIVIAFQLIEHIPPNEVSSFLSEVKRVLKRKGSLFITTPNRRFRLIPFQRPFNPEHYREFTAESLLKILKTTFEGVQIKGIRAEESIEDIERKRVRKCPYRVYIRDPLYRFLNMVLPMEIKGALKKIKFKMMQSSQSESRISDSDDRFNNLFQKFSMDNFYLESQ